MTTPTMNFFYHRPRTRMQASVAYLFERDTGHVSWAASFVHANLDRFEKSKGREVACANMETMPRFLEISPNSNREDVQNAIVGQLRQYRRDLGELKKVAEQLQQYHKGLKAKQKEKKMKKSTAKSRSSAASKAWDTRRANARKSAKTTKTTSSKKATPRATKSSSMTADARSRAAKKAWRTRRKNVE